MLYGCIFEMLVTSNEVEKVAILERFSFLAVIYYIISPIMFFLRLLGWLRWKKLIKNRVSYSLSLFFAFYNCISIFIGGWYTKRSSQLPALVRWVWRWKMSCIIKFSEFLLVILRWAQNICFLVIVIHLYWFISFWCVFTSFVLLLCALHFNTLINDI